MPGLFDGALRLPGLFGDPRDRLPGGVLSNPAAPPINVQPLAGSGNVQRILPTRMDGIRAAIGGATNTIFGGEDDPRLSGAQNDSARRMAMLRAGLQMLAASGPSAQPVGLGQVLATGAMAGQEAGVGERERLYMSTQEERIRQALADPDLAGMLTPEQRRLLHLLPPQEATKMLLEALTPKPEESKVVTAGGALIGPDGKVIYQSPREEPEMDLPGDLKAVLWQAGVDPKTMTPDQRAAALERYEEMKRAGGTTVNVNTERRQDFADTNALGVQFRQEIAEHQQVARGYGRVLAATANPSAAGDMSLVFAYMKMLDPTSSVREGEQASAQNAGSIPERVRAAYNKAVSGQRFTPEQRADFINQARRLATQSQRELQPVLRRFRERAEAGGVDAGMVVFDPFAEAGLAPVAPPKRDALSDYLP